MNEKNLEYLKDSLKWLGFGDKLNRELEQHFKEGKPEFTLHIVNAVRADLLSSSLHFRKSGTTDMYYFNSYNAVLKQPGKDEKGQTFYIDKGKGITAREAYNLLDGRSVYKELSNKAGEKYPAWIKLDLENKSEHGQYKIQQFNNNYGYNLLEAIQNLPIKDANKEKEAELVKYLQKGGVAPVIVIGKQGDAALYIAANPQFKTMDMFDGDGKPLSKAQKEALQYQLDAALHQRNGQAVEDKRGEGGLDGQRESAGMPKDHAGLEENQDQKQDSKINPSSEEKLDKKGNRQSAKQPRAESLLPKKRTSTGKGLKA